MLLASLFLEVCPQQLHPEHSVNHCLRNKLQQRLEKTEKSFRGHELHFRIIMIHATALFLCSPGLPGLMGHQPEHASSVGERVMLKASPHLLCNTTPRRRPQAQADKLTGLHGCGIGSRAGGPSAGPVVGPHSHVVLGVGVQASDQGSGVQPCCPYSVSGCFFVPSFPVADLKEAGGP